MGSVSLHTSWAVKASSTTRHRVEQKLDDMYELHFDYYSQTRSVGILFT